MVKASEKSRDAIDRFGELGLALRDGGELIGVSDWLREYLASKPHLQAADAFIAALGFGQDWDAGGTEPGERSYVLMMVHSLLVSIGSELRLALLDSERAEAESGGVRQEDIATRIRACCKAFGTDPGNVRRDILELIELAHAAGPSEARTREVRADVWCSHARARARIWCWHRGIEWPGDDQVNTAIRAAVQARVAAPKKPASGSGKPIPFKYRPYAKALWHLFNLCGVPMKTTAEPDTEDDWEKFAEAMRRTLQPPTPESRKKAAENRRHARRKKTLRKRA